MVVLSGCATPAASYQMTVAKVRSDVSFPTNFVKNVQIGSVFGGEETNPLWTSEISSANFSEAMRLSLTHNGLYSSSGAFSLDLSILEVEQPVVGIDMTVELEVLYSLKDHATGKEVHRSTIHSEYTAPFSSALYAPARLRKANEGAARESINSYLETLGTLTENDL